MTKLATQLSSATRVGLDLAKHVFQNYGDSALNSLTEKAPSI